MKSSCALAAALLLLVASASSIQAASEDVPVFVWGKPSVTYVPALSSYSTSEFGALIESQADENTFVLVFAEERLSTEDLSLCKLNTQTCFRNLAKVERKSYLPNVQEPLGAFDDIPSENIQSVQVSAADGSLSERIVPKGGSVAIVNLSGDDFSSHDALIDSLYNQLREQFPNILAVYTGKTPSFRYSALVRRTRQAQQPDETPVKINMLKVDKEFMIAYEVFRAGPVGGDAELPEVTLTAATKNAANSSEDTLQIDITGTSASLALHFHLTQGSWEIVGVTYNNAQYYLRHRIHINQHFSYHCYNLEYYTTDMKNKIVFEEVQVQPFWASEAAADAEPFGRFGDAWDCVGFTSPGILTGLFLLVIFIFIGAYGITWMMDIRTMDRFDDPKGKTITVNVAE
uniref:Putative vacuolar atp synthase subunit s1 n=1 Tax=Psorophora albipes TaxID=869069 RepID=T1DEB0_9DIPT